MREDAAARGRRLVAEGRLVIRRVDQNEVAAVCRGDSGEVHALGFSPDREWWCSCPAMRRCGHLVALQLVTLTPIGTWTTDFSSVGGRAAS
jgi:hypothetical protein